MIKKITGKKYFLLILVIVNSFIMLFSGLFAPNPRIIFPVGLFLGIITFGLVYAIPGKFSIRSDIYLLLISFSQSFLGSILLQGACKFISKPVCSTNLLRAQVFGNFAFPMLIITILWITIRVPLFFRRK